ncbi:MAG: DUF5320 domain-containing protein [Anaerolineae bacterium]
MPRGDRTGPMGAGPMTGRGLGYCAGNPAPGYAYGGPGMGWGRGMGWGGGRGWRHGYRATGLPFWARYDPGVWGPVGARPTREEEVSYLQDQAQALQEQLNAIQGRIDELRGGDE